MKTVKLLTKIITYIILISGVIIIFLPLYLTVITAFKTTPESSKSFFSFPAHFYLGNFKEVITSSNYFGYVANSTVITVVSIAVIVVFIPMVSFAISRNSKKLYFKFLYVYLLSAIFVPFQVIMLPIVKTMYGYNLMNQIGLIILYITLALSQGVFLCVGYLKSIPFELEEAAFIDGCNVWTAFIRIIYPMMLPITITVMIMDALWIWNDFQLPLVILNKTPAYWTLPLFQFNFKGQYSFDYNLAFAAFFLSMIPIVVVYSIFQKYIIGGLTEGSIKS